MDPVLAGTDAEKPLGPEEHIERIWKMRTQYEDDSEYSNVSELKRALDMYERPTSHYL